jgi:hypothetical protein
MSHSITKLPVEPVSSNSMISNSVASGTRASELQSYLTTFIQSALKQSRSGHLPVERSLQLLDKAWRMQKLLWQLRNHISTN